MATCILSRSSSTSSLTSSSYSCATTHDPIRAKRKRVFNDVDDADDKTDEIILNCAIEAEEIDERTKKEYSFDESKQTNETHKSARSLIESTRFDDSLPGLLRRKKISLSPYTYIKDVSSAEETTQRTKTFLSSNSNKEKDNQTTMIACSQQNEFISQTENKDQSMNFLTNAELAAYMTKSSTNLLIIDCGSSLRYNERKIHGSLSLNINDKISRRRFATRGLKNFLDNEQLNLLDRTEIIVLYDDFIRPPNCANTLLSSQVSTSIKTISDELKKYNSNKIVLVLQSPFDDFFKHYPQLCDNALAAVNHDSVSLDPPLTCQSIDIDMFEISEILPGLYLGNARDAADKNLLTERQIQTIINVSNTIPCHFAGEQSFEYRQLLCEDSFNQSLLEHFDETFQMIDERLKSNRNVLVHCQGGVSRSPSFVIGYLMKYHSKTFDQAYQWVKSKRSIVNPNLNFVGQLTQYQRILAARN